MKIGTFRRFFNKDYPDVPSGSWFSALLGNLNEFTDPVITALRNGLTYDDNFNQEKKTVTIPHNTELKIGVSSIPSEVRLISTSGAMVTGFAWKPLSNVLISITVRFDDEKSHSGTVRIYY